MLISLEISTFEVFKIDMLIKSMAICLELLKFFECVSVDSVSNVSVNIADIKEMMRSIAKNER